MKERKRGKKGISPVVSTILLIMMVVIIAIIIVLWARGFIKEIILKEVAGESKRIEQFCSQIQMKIILDESDGSFGITNEGNVPIFGVNLKLTEKDTGKSDTIPIENNINPGFSVKFEKSPGEYYNRDDYEAVKVIPILLGKTKSGLVTKFQCPESNGIDI